MVDPVDKLRKSSVGELGHQIEEGAQALALAAHVMGTKEIIIGCTLNMTGIDYEITIKRRTP